MILRIEEKVFPFRFSLLFQTMFFMVVSFFFWER